MAMTHEGLAARSPAFAWLKCQSILTGIAVHSPCSDTLCSALKPSVVPLPTGAGGGRGTSASVPFPFSSMYTLTCVGIRFETAV